MDTYLCLTRATYARCFRTRTYLFSDLFLFLVLNLVSYSLITPSFSQTTIQIGTGTQTSFGSPENPFDASQSHSRTNFVFTKADLNSNGANNAGILSQIGFQFIPSPMSPEYYAFPNINLTDFTIRLKHISTSTLTGFDGTGTTVYERASIAGTTLNSFGPTWNSFTFDTPFHWNGNDNLLIEICFSSSGNPSFQGQLYVFNRSDAMWQVRSNAAGPACGIGGGNVANVLPLTQFLYEEVAIPLPVEMTSFIATCQNGLTSLNWETASEKNNHYFHIEKSSDGIHWRKIGKVLAQGSTSNATNYSFYDSQKNNQEIVYYRLHQFDYDGKNEIFGPISAGCSFEENTFVIVPNPTSEDASLQIIWTKNASSIYLALWDVTGKVLKHQKQSILKGQQTIALSMEDVPQGIYFLQITDQEKHLATRKIVKN